MVKPTGKIISFKVQGLPMSAAPKEVASYLDCVDGAIIWKDMMGGPPTLELHRGGEVVGEVNLGNVDDTD